MKIDEEFLKSLGIGKIEPFYMPWLGKRYIYSRKGKRDLNPSNPGYGARPNPTPSPSYSGGRKGKRDLI